MILKKEIDSTHIFLEMTPDEYNRMCDFMIKNGVGYGPGRKLCEEWRLAREGYNHSKPKGK